MDLGYKVGTFNIGEWGAKIWKRKSEGPLTSNPRHYYYKTPHSLTPSSLSLVGSQFQQSKP